MAITRDLEKDAEVGFIPQDLNYGRCPCLSNDYATISCEEGLGSFQPCRPREEGRGQAGTPP